MELSAELVLVLVSVAIPVLTGLITKADAKPTVKQVVTITLAAVNAVVVANVAEDGSAVLTNSVLLDAGVSWAIAVTSYLGIYKPHDSNDHLAATKGLG